MTHPSPEYVRGLLEGTTPGDWRTKGRSRNNGHEYISGVVADAGDVLSGTQLRPNGVTIGQAKANAALIAASPSIARAYVALAERVGVLEVALDAAESALDQLLDDMGEKGHTVCDQAKEEAIDALSTVRAALTTPTPEGTAHAE